MAPLFTSPRRVVGTLLTLLLAGFLFGAAPAHAEDGFRYWNYSHLKGDAFVFAQTGPGDYTPKDGDVEGWRYGTSTVSQGIEPRADLSEVSFETVCGDAEAAEGEKRVAVLVDYGTPADAADGAQVPEPVAECAVVPEDATGQQTLEAVAEVRADGAMICALDGYPAKGCGEPVSDATVATAAEPVEFQLTGSEAAGDGDNDWMLVAVIGVIIALAIAAYPLYRRNRDA